METLLLALILGALCESGDKAQQLTAALGARFARGAVLAGLLLAVITATALSAVAGSYLAPLMPGPARLLFLALALLFAGTTLIFPARAPDMVEGWRIGAFPTSFLALFILLFWDRTQFVILGLVARGDDPVAGGIGGTLGLCAVLVPVLYLKESWPTLLPWASIRRVTALLLCVAGVVLGIAAVGAR